MSGPCWWKASRDALPSRLQVETADRDALGLGCIVVVIVVTHLLQRGVGLQLACL